MAETRYIEVHVRTQMLMLFSSAGEVLREYRIATARNGVGEELGSERTPRGRHIICAKIGAGAPLGAVFVGRRPTGEIYHPDIKRENPARDWILTRILWLKGLEPGRNRGGSCDSMRRYIYIHGAPDENAMGVPGSRGCVNMRNTEIVELFDLVTAGTLVNILE